MRNADGHYSPRRLTAKENGAKALELRKTGLSYSGIAQALGYKSPQTAHNAVESALKALIQEPGEEVLRLELERLDAILMPMVLAAKTGDQGAVDRVIKVMDRRSKYLGLDAPVKVAPTDPSGQNPYLHMPDEELANEVSKILANAGVSIGHVQGQERPELEKEGKT